MSDDLKNPPAVRETRGLALPYDEDLAYAAQLAAASRADSTRQNYEADFAHWKAYAEAHGLRVFPVNRGGLAAYLGHLTSQGYAVSTIDRRCAAITYFHNTHKVDGKFVPSPVHHPSIRATLQGYRSQNEREPNRKEPLTLDLVRRIVDFLEGRDPEHPPPATEYALRDRTLILVGFITGMRRSELAALEWDHITEFEEGSIIRIPKSKTDQKREGQQVGIPRTGHSRYCPLVALDEWWNYLEEQENDSAYVFGCSAKTINRIVKRCVSTILGPEEAKRYGAHSFRSGYTTEAHRSGGRLEDIMAQTRHRSRTVAQGYIRKGELMQNTATLQLLQHLQETPDETDS